MGPDAQNTAIEENSIITSNGNHKIVKAGVVVIRRSGKYRVDYIYKLFTQSKKPREANGSFFQI